MDTNHTAAAANDYSRTETKTLFCYIPLLRPASFPTLPAGWVYVETPREVAARRPDLPASAHRHGVVGYARRLSGDEVRDFQLRYDGERPAR